METPQYLRRRLFKLVPELQYAGTLPPLRTAHHPTANKTANLELGELRDGVVLSTTEGSSLVDIGVEKPALILEGRLKPSSRVTIKITELRPQLKGVLTDSKAIRTYWGFKVSISKALLAQLLETRQFDLKIATSRTGKPITAVIDNLKERWKSSSKTLVAFGAPTQGLYEIINREHKNLDNEVDYVVNAIPDQATETIRTEEAVYATLAILNILSR
jgi:predicted SPOUT superfamily RNA methylase MTH1